METLTKNPLYNFKIVSLAELGFKPKYEVGRKDEKNKHLYTINGGETWFVGVSTILETLSKPYLVPWSAKECSLRIAILIKRLRDEFGEILFKPGVFEVEPSKVFSLFQRLLSNQLIDRVVKLGKSAHEKKKDLGADIGTRAHQAIDNMIKGFPVVITPDIELPIEGFLHFMATTKLRVASGDIKVASIQEEYGGSIDVSFVTEREQIVIGDFKTSNQFGRENIFQVAFYGNAFRETYGLSHLPPGFVIRFDKVKPIVETRGINFMNEAYKCAESLLCTYRLLQINYWSETERWSFKKNKKNDNRPTDERPKENAK